jgi:MFS family permease
VPLLAGAAADTADRRRLMLAGELVILTASVALLANALLAQPRVWVLFGAEVVGTAGWSIARPSMSAATPRLVPRELIPSAVALQSVYSNFAHVAGPAFGGVLIAAIGLPGAYAVDVATFGASLTAAWLLPAIPPVEEAGERGLRAVLEALRYVRARRVLLGIFLVDTNAMIFGMPSALFPAFAEQLGGGARTVGILYAAPYAGAFAASVVSGWIGRVRRQGLGVCVAAAGWGVAIAIFGLTGSLWSASIALAAAGAADFVSAVLRDTLLLTAAPDELRGRLSGIELAQVASAPALGNLEAGVVASLAGVRASVVSGGVLTVLGTVAVAAALPALVRYDARRGG